MLRVYTIVGSKSVGEKNMGIWEAYTEQKANKILNSTINEDILVSPNGTGVLSVLGTTNYETNVTTDDDIPNKKYVDDAITVEDLWDKVGTTLFPATVTNNISNTGTLASGNHTIGSGAAGVDYFLAFNGETTDSQLNWLEDEKVLQLSTDSAAYRETDAFATGALTVNDVSSTPTDVRYAISALTGAANTQTTIGGIKAGFRTTNAGLSYDEAIGVRGFNLLDQLNSDVAYLYSGYFSNRIEATSCDSIEITGIYIQALESWGGALSPNACPDLYGIYIADSIGTPTRAHGIYIEDINSGTSNWAIKTLGGDIEFTDGNVTTTGTISGMGMQKVIFSSNVNFKATDPDTTIYTVPAGYMFLLDEMEVVTTTLTGGAGTAPTIRFGNSGTPAAYFTAAVVSSNAVGERHIIPNPQQGIVATTAITAGVTVGSTAVTTHTGHFILRGTLLAI
jgi:hypothetical protein